MNHCPDEALCKRLGWHCHGYVYQLYQTNQDYRDKINAVASIKKEEVGVFQKAVNFVKSISRYVASGLVRVDDATLVQRLSICESCDRFKRENRTCLECGCYMDIKASWASEECPLKKWLALPIRSVAEQAQPKPPCGCHQAT